MNTNTNTPEQYRDPVSMVEPYSKILARVALQHELRATIEASTVELLASATWWTPWGYAVAPGRGVS